MTKKEKEIIKKYVNEAWERLIQTEKEILEEYEMTTSNEAHVINKLLEHSKKYQNRLYEWALLDDLAKELKVKEIYEE